jgi:hypothetical protein
MIQIRSRSNYRILKILGLLGGYTPPTHNFTPEIRRNSRVPHLRDGVIVAKVGSRLRGP